MTADARIQVFTFKEGVLSRLGHDLRLSLQRYEIDVRDGRVQGKFWPASLNIDGAMKNGRLDSFALDAQDRRKIAANIERELFDVRRHPIVELEASVEGVGSGRFVVDGNLTMAGRPLQIRETVRVEDDRLRCRVTLIPSRWGIKPYRAPLGALKVQDRVIVEADLPFDVDGMEAADPAASACRWAAEG